MDHTEARDTGRPTHTAGTSAPEEGRARAPEEPVLLSGTEQLLAAIPHVIGYHPRDSIVLVATAPGPAEAPCRRRSVMTARLDLPPAGHADRLVGLFGPPLARVAEETVDGGADAEGCLLLHVFLHDATDDVADEVLQAVWTLAGTGGHHLHDVLLVREGRYLPLVADGSPGRRALQVVLGRGPAEVSLRGGAQEETWLPVPGAADVPGVADLVLRGRSPAAGREEVAAAVRHLDADAAAATAAALESVGTGADGAGRGPAVPEVLGRLSRWVVEGEDEPDAAGRAAVVAALADRVVRDAVMARWLPRLFSVEEVLGLEDARELRRLVRPWPVPDDGALDRLLGLAARVPREVAAPLLTLAGTVAWGHGEGTVANEAVDLALESDPGYRMALLVRTALEHGLPPWRSRAQAA